MHLKKLQPVDSGSRKPGLGVQGYESTQVRSPDGPGEVKEQLWSVIAAPVPPQALRGRRYYPNRGRDVTRMRRRGTGCCLRIGRSLAVLLDGCNKLAPPPPKVCHRGLPTHGDHRGDVKGERSHSLLIYDVASEFHYWYAFSRSSKTPLCQPCVFCQLQAPKIIANGHLEVTAAH